MIPVAQTSAITNVTPVFARNVVLDVHKLTKNTYHTVLNIRSTQEEENNRKSKPQIPGFLFRKILIIRFFE